MKFNELPKKKKRFGQHFLKKQSVVDHMVEKVQITPEIRVMEIGCGDGFLTRAILESKCKELYSFEIDPEWANLVKNSIKDARLKIIQANILEINWEEQLYAKKPWVLLSNLPYQITFPILFLILKHRSIFLEGVVMVQEEVAQKLVATSKRSYNATSLYLQHFFNFELMEKIEPDAFSPPPKIFSRLVYFKPKAQLELIPKEDEFWSFLKDCFKSPRRTIRNNLKATSFDIAKFSDEFLDLRAQQVGFDKFLKEWELLNK